MAAGCGAASVGAGGMRWADSGSQGHGDPRDGRCAAGWTVGLCLGWHWRERYDSRACRGVQRSDGRSGLEGADLHDLRRAVVANGTLYVGADDGTVRAFDAATGAPRWSFTRTVGVSSQLGLDGYVAVSGDTVFVTSDAGAVYALDAATGKQRWLYTLTDSADQHLYHPTLGSGWSTWPAAVSVARSMRST